MYSSKSFLIIEHFTAKLRDQTFTPMGIQGSCGQPIFKETVLFFMCCLINCSRVGPIAHFGRPLFKSWLTAVKDMIVYNMLKKFVFKNKEPSSLALISSFYISGVCIEYM